MVEPSKPRVSVVVVNFNTKDALRRCLDSIEAHHETIVVDNASTDGSSEMVAKDFPGVRLIPNDANVGFGAANNQGIRAASGEWVLLFNSDAWATPGSIDRLAGTLDHQGAVAGGGRLLNPDGTLQPSVARQLTLGAVLSEQLYLERFTHAYWRDPASFGEPAEVDQVMGACLMMKPVAFFDERFFLYCEDTELCHRLKEMGPIVHEPKAEFFHELGTSSTTNRWLSVARYNRGKELYFLIHHGKAQMAACWVLNRLGAILRFAAWTLISLVTLGRTQAQMWLFLRVLFAPVSGPPDPRKGR